MYIYNISGVSVAQLEEAWVANHTVDRSVSGVRCAKSTQSLQQAFNTQSRKPQKYLGHVKDSPLPFTHWASVKTTWCCQPGCVAHCIYLDYIDSSRSGRHFFTAVNMHIIQDNQGLVILSKVHCGWKLRHIVKNYLTVPIFVLFIKDK